MVKGRVLIVDNDPQIRRMMRVTLTAQGLEVGEARSGREALEGIGSTRYDLVILDINMPGIDGLETCEQIRARSDVPIIMLTVRVAEEDKTQAFDSGADDYVTKPFSTPELLARVRAALRRKKSPLEFQRQHLHLGDIEIDFEAREIRSPKQQHRLTPKEFELLAYLASHANRLVTHQELLTGVWGSEDGGEKEYLRVFINRLRKKLEAAPDNPKYLLTEHWLGYRLRLPE
jgi:two-component system KDP operon response regulator KdpE